MGKISLALIGFIVLFALTAPLVLADDGPPPSTPSGGCSGPDCK